MLMGASSGLASMQARVVRRASAPQLLNVVNPLDYHLMEDTDYVYRSSTDGTPGSLSEDQLRQQLRQDRQGDGFNPRQVFK